jgi:hypothetical protein
VLNLLDQMREEFDTLFDTLTAQFATASLKVRRLESEAQQLKERDGDAP